MQPFTGHGESLSLSLSLLYELKVPLPSRDLCLIKEKAGKEKKIRKKREKRCHVSHLL